MFCNNDGFCSICGIWCSSERDFQTKFIPCQSQICAKSYHRRCLPSNFRRKNLWKTCNDIYTTSIIDINNNASTETSIIKFSCDSDRPAKPYFCWTDDPYKVQKMNSDKTTNKMIGGECSRDKDEQMEGNSHLSRKHESCIIRGIPYSIGDDIKLHIYLTKIKKNTSNVRNHQKSYREYICKIDAIDEDFDDRIIVLTVCCFWTESELWEEFSSKPSQQSFMNEKYRLQYKHLQLNKKLRIQAQDYHLFFDEEYQEVIQGLKKFDIIGKVLIVNEYQEFTLLKNKLKQLRMQSRKQSLTYNLAKENTFSIADTENAQILDGKYMDVYWCDFTYSSTKNVFENCELINISSHIRQMQKEKINKERIYLNNEIENEKKTKNDNDIHAESDSESEDMSILSNNACSTKIVEQQKNKKESEIIQSSKNEQHTESNYMNLSVNIKPDNRGQWLTVEEFTKELEAVEFMNESEKMQALENCANYWKMKD